MGHQGSVGKHMKGRGFGQQTLGWTPKASLGPFRGFGTVVNLSECIQVNLILSLILCFYYLNHRIPLEISVFPDHPVYVGDNRFGVRHQCFGSDRVLVLT